MKYLTFRIQGMSCDGCVNSVTRTLKNLKGAMNVEVTLDPGTAVVRIDAAHLNASQVEAAITALGYSATLTNAGPDVHGLP